MVIADATLRRNVWTTVKGLINTDKSGYGASSTPTIYGSYPDSDPTFPCIVIENVKSDEGEYTLDKTRTSKTKDVLVVIHIFTRRSLDLDYIADGIVATLEAPIDGIVLVSITDADGAVFPNDQKVHLKTLSCMFKRRS